MSCNGDIWTENPVSSPWVASVAIKAAELQGKKAGKVYLRKIQESVFLKKEDISDEKILIDCARETHLDLDEFERDLYSVSAQKAVQCDLKLTKEMDRKSTRLNSSHVSISYAVFCLKKKQKLCYLFFSTYEDVH